MRKEADDAGPMAELQHWRQRMAKFNSLLEQIKAKKCKTVIGILLVGKSKILKVNSSENTYCFIVISHLFGIE